MPTVSRLLLVFTWLLFGPLVAMADEFPKDTYKIKSLTVEEAKRLVKEFKGVEVQFECLDDRTVELRNSLPLNGLKKLDHEVAQVLTGYKTGPLILQGLGVIDAATAAALAEFKGKLSLDGLTTIDADSAKALAKFKGSDLYLNGLTTLDTDTAKALAAFSVDAPVQSSLHLHGLQRASFGAVRALRQNPHVFIPNHWYLLRYEIAALVGTVVFVIMGGIVVWYSRRQRAEG
jgi:hypothetical protein